MNYQVFLKATNRTQINSILFTINVVFLTSKLTVPFIFNGRLCVVSDKKAKQAKLRLPLTYKRLIVWDIYGPLYVIGKRKQQGSSNFAPRQTSPRGIFCDDQSAFSIPLGINEKKGSEEHIKSRQAWLQWQSDIIYCFSPS